MNLEQAVNMFGAIVRSFSLDDSYSLDEIRSFSQAVGRLPDLKLSEDRRMTVCRDLEFANVSKMVVASSWSLKVLTSCEVGLVVSAHTDSGTFFAPIRISELTESLRAGGGMIDFAHAMAFRVELTKLVTAYRSVLEEGYIDVEVTGSPKEPSFKEKNAARVASDQQFGAW